MDKGWFGIILAVIGAIVGLLGGFVWHSLGWTAAFCFHRVAPLNGRVYTACHESTNTSFNISSCRHVRECSSGRFVA